VRRWGSAREAERERRAVTGERTTTGAAGAAETGETGAAAERMRALVERAARNLAEAERKSGRLRGNSGILRTNQV
jgi:hypothetical protein